MRICVVLAACAVSTSCATSLKGLSGCEDGITCKEIAANGLTFNCRFADTSTDLKGSVLLLHGFPEWSSMYMPLMRLLSKQGYTSVACDQRGYSPKASPDNVSDYEYTSMVNDTFAIAEAAGFSKYHLVGHDHGACLGWKVAGTDGGEKVLSYTSLSIPHIDAFSAGLWGTDADPKQQSASQYFPLFVEKGSAGSWYNPISFYNVLWTFDKKPFGVQETGFSSPKDFQKALWWYTGALPQYMSMPPVLKGSLATYFPGLSLKPNNGTEVQQKLGPVDVPSLYVCGNQDSAILCSRPYALATKNYVTKDYAYLEANCGHGLLQSSCKDLEKVQSGIIAHIQKHT